MDGDASGEAFVVTLLTIAIKRKERRSSRLSQHSLLSPCSRESRQYASGERDIKIAGVTACPMHTSMPA